MQKDKVKSHSVQKLQWKRTDEGDCITSGANSVINKNNSTSFPVSGRRADLLPYPNPNLSFKF